MEVAKRLPTYEILAVKYAGPFSRPLARMLWNSSLDEQIWVNYYVWVIRGAGQALVVDCGVAPALAEQMALDGYVSPAQALARVGVEAAQVEKVIVTHVHLDHISGIELFPHATVFVQRREFEFWVKDPVAQKPPFRMVTDPVGNAHLARLEGTPRLVLVDGDNEIAPGIEVVLAPGHTPGLQAVRVHTAKGWAILGSDCAHIFRNYRESIPSWYITDMVAWMHSYDTLRGLASSPDLLFPGHDAAMRTDYPQVAEDVTRLA